LTVRDIIGIVQEIGNPGVFDLSFESDSAVGFDQPFSLFGGDPSKFVLLAEGNGLSVNVTVERLDKQAFSADNSSQHAVSLWHRAAVETTDIAMPPMKRSGRRRQR
jgi:hypothetical protein